MSREPPQESTGLHVSARPVRSNTIAWNTHPSGGSYAHRSLRYTRTPDNWGSWPRGDRGAYRAAPPRNGRRRRAVRLLLDEMYPATVAAALRNAGVDAVMVAALGLAGRSDLDVFTATVADDYVLLTRERG
jgi:hypothetical protein